LPNFYEILRFCTRLQVDFKFLVWSLSRDKHSSYKHFSAVGTFFHKFSITPSGETTNRIKKIRGCKNGTDLLCHLAKYGGNPGSRAGCRQKSVMLFFVCLFFVTLLNDEVCDNGNDMKQYNFQNNYGLIAYRKVCSCALTPVCSNFPIDPHNFFLRGKFLPKITIFGDFWCRMATVLKPQR